MHEHIDGGSQRTVSDLAGILAAHAVDKLWVLAMAELREAANGCPACILAAINASGLQKYNLHADNAASFGFDFKKELTEFWRVRNEADLQNERYG